MGAPSVDETAQDRVGEEDVAEHDGADSGGSEAAAPAERSQDDPLAAAEAQAAQNWDKYLRATAEVENVRKRAQRDVEKAHKFSIERFANDLLAVADSLEMGIEAAEGTKDQGLLEGSTATLKLLRQVFERFGVVQMDPLGEPFDPEFHEAMTLQPSPDAEPGSVMIVVQRGYTLNGRLLRPARVIVAAAPETGA